MAQIRIAQSIAEDPELAAAELAAQWRGETQALVVFFCSPAYDATVLGAALRRHVPAPTRLIGCSTAGEIGLAGYQENSLVALALPAADFVAVTAVIGDLRNMDMLGWQDTVKGLVQQNAENQASAGYANAFALMFVDGLSTREEPLARTIKMALGSIPLIGGSAGDGLSFERTFVFHDDAVLSNAAVVALISTRRVFRTFKTQHFVRSQTRMVVTGARPADRVVTEINGYPAALEFARMAGVDLGQLSPFCFAAHPVVVRVGGGEYVRSIQKVNPDHSLTFYCAIDSGLVLCLAEGVDAIQNLEAMLAEVRGRIGEPEAILACDCILRNLEFQQPETRAAISGLMRRNHFLGFSTYGEQYEGMHVNQTLTGIAFGTADDES